jgi:hypothetical protein
MVTGICSGISCPSTARPWLQTREELADVLGESSDKHMALHMEEQEEHDEAESLHG